MFMLCYSCLSTTEVLPREVKRNTKSCSEQESHHAKLGHMLIKHLFKGSLHPDHFLRLLLGLGGSGALADPP